MDTKLTLKLDKKVIEKAKAYAASNKSSLSRIVEAYLQSLTEKNELVKDEIEISPFVKSMSTGVQLPNDLDYKKEYADDLEEKYKWKKSYLSTTMEIEGTLNLPVDLPPDNLQFFFFGKGFNGSDNGFNA